MANLKNKILNALQNGNSLETILEDLSRSQENLLKNHSNPVFSIKDKNKLLTQYTNLDNLGKSLYRYNALSENNLDSDSERTAIENEVLKGGVSYNKYVWHSENGEHTCEVCKSLDGQVFDFYDEVPERPHPNCKCTVEIVEDNSEEPSPQNNGLSCDLLKQLNGLINEMETANALANQCVEELKLEVDELENDLERVNALRNEINDYLEILSEDYKKHFPWCENNIDEEYENLEAREVTLEILWNDIKNLLDMGWTGIATFLIFASNYAALLYRAYVLKEYEMDKYYHSKANCEATQAFGELGEEAAILLSDFKENFDQYKNIYASSHKVSIEEAIADSERDQVANRLGRERGRNYPSCKCYELMQDLLPDYKK